MAKISKKQSFEERYQELYEKSFTLQATEANGDGDLTLLNKLFFEEKKLDILEKTPKEKWNWLHRCNLLSAAPLSVVQFYIDHGVEVNAQDMYGMTPLHYAMRSKNAAAAIALLNAGADPNIPNRDGLIPLSMIGYIREHLDVLELMLKNGGNVHYEYQNEGSVLERYKPRDNETRNIAIYDMMLKYQ
ncbi:ankyrin repeat domain-containing protein [Testudinibacter sp. TR-2022]|uniref:ankyrin repeat domain-containing protein n=1 Tax=Testudinibacter sp. TR-2022 TaxID=2585029 RepID=UPI00111ADBC9|nr:ankyrin repeat domain-containing protein [Testudinibacter sp. TR-2022]TNH20982.1 ankyrin repeat domain-containing protein [Testudinibacter sp. TR-2022]